MGLFGKAFKWVNDKAKKVASFHNIGEKVKKGWNQGTQLLGKARALIPKAKKVLEVASLVPVVGEYTAPLLAGLETADATLKTIDKYKKKAEKGYGKAKAIHSKVGRYAQKIDKAKTFDAKMKIAERATKEGVEGYNKYKSNPQDFFN